MKKRRRPTAREDALNHAIKMAKSVERDLSAGKTEAEIKARYQAGVDEFPVVAHWNRQRRQKLN